MQVHWFYVGLIGDVLTLDGKGEIKESDGIGEACGVPFEFAEGVQSSDKMVPSLVGL